MRSLRTGVTDQTIIVHCFDSDGAAVTLTSGSAGLSMSYRLDSAGREGTPVSMTPVARLVAGTHRDGAITSKGDGKHEIDLPDAAFASAGYLTVVLSATDVTGRVYSEILAVGITVELDSASRLAIWNTLTTETFTADSFGELLIISDGTNGRAVKVTGANHIAADVHDCQADGLSGSTEIANIQDAAGWLLAIGSGAVANPQTSTEQYDITQFGVNYRVAMAGLTSTGTRTAPTLSKP